MRNDIFQAVDQYRNTHKEGIDEMELYFKKDELIITPNLKDLNNGQY